MARSATLSPEESLHLALSVFEVLAHVEDGEALRADWVDEMRSWCEVILDRREA